MLGFGPLSELAISDISLQKITGTIYVTDSDDTATLTGAISITGSISVTDTDDFAVISGIERVDGYILETDSPDIATLTGGVAITGLIDTTDENDTADIEAAAIVSGSIDTTDDNDTANINGLSSISGSIDVTDENDTASIYGTSGSQEIDTHDGFTKEEVKRYKKIQKQLAVAEAKRIQAKLDKRLQRKASIQAEVAPETVAKLNETKLESTEEVKQAKPVIDVAKINAEIARLEAKKQELLQAVAVRNELARLHTELAIYEAKVRAEEQDDEESILALLL